MTRFLAYLLVYGMIFVLLLMGGTTLTTDVATGGVLLEGQRLLGGLAAASLLLALPGLACMAGSAAHPWARLPSRPAGRAAAAALAALVFRAGPYLLPLPVAAALASPGSIGGPALLWVGSVFGIALGLGLVIARRCGPAAAGVARGAGPARLAQAGILYGVAVLLVVRAIRPEESLWPLFPPGGHLSFPGSGVVLPAPAFPPARFPLPRRSLEDLALAGAILAAGALASMAVGWLAFLRPEPEARPGAGPTPESASAAPPASGPAGVETPAPPGRASGAGPPAPRTAPLMAFLGCQLMLAFNAHLAAPEPGHEAALLFVLSEALLLSGAVLATGELEGWVPVGPLFAFVVGIGSLTLLASFGTGSLGLCLALVQLASLVVVTHLATNLRSLIRLRFPGPFGGALLAVGTCFTGGFCLMLDATFLKLLHLGGQTFILGGWGVLKSLASLGFLIFSWTLVAWQRD